MIKRPGPQGLYNPAYEHDACGVAMVAKLDNIPSHRVIEQALEALDKDRAFLKEGGVFTDDLIETWVEYKRTNEVDPIRLRPHPHEFELYYDI